MKQKWTNWRQNELLSEAESCQAAGRPAQTGKGTIASSALSQPRAVWTGRWSWAQLDCPLLPVSTARCLHTVFTAADSKLWRTQAAWHRVARSPPPQRLLSWRWLAVSSVFAGRSAWHEPLIATPPPPHPVPNRRYVVSVDVKHYQANPSGLSVPGPSSQQPTSVELSMVTVWWCYRYNLHHY